MKQNIVAIIEARVNSKRLPGKVLKKIGNKTMLEILIERIQKSKFIKNIVIATSLNDKDRKIASLANKIKINYFRGSENNVLDRVSRASIKFKADIIVQLTGDNPFVDYEVIDKMLLKLLKNKLDFITNNYFGDNNNRTYPIGTDVRIFYQKHLQAINSFNVNSTFREHPSLFFYKNKHNLFRCKNINLSSKFLKIQPRLTVDTKSDFKFLEKIYLSLSKEKEYFNINDILKFLNDNKNLLGINKKIKQKVVKN